MADAKISALPAVTTVSVASEFALNEAGTTKKMTLQQLLNTDPQILTASGAVVAGTAFLELDHDSVVIAATIAATLGVHRRLSVKNTSDSGTAAHTVTLTAGTWDGTATIATLNAPAEHLIVEFDSEGDGTVIENVGGVVLS